jgi:hypothetical protein
MAENIPERILRDFLTDPSRKERKALLALSAVGLAIGWGNLVPTDIPGLGVTLEPNDQGSLVLLVTGVIAYFLVSFVIYAWADLQVALSHAFGVGIESELESYKRTIAGHDDPSRIDDAVERETFQHQLSLESRLHRLARRAVFAVRLRTIIDFAVPTLAAAAAIYSLLQRSAEAFRSGSGF